MEAKRREFCTMTVPTAKWKVFRECNYQCSYCTVWQDCSEDPSSELASAYAAAVSETIPDGWRVYLTGGELTVRKRTTEAVIQQLSHRGHELRIISNLSAPVEYYLRLLELSTGRLGSIFLTRHRGCVPVSTFADKVRDLRNRLPSSCELLARQVVETGEDGIRDFLQCRERLGEAGVELYPLRLVVIENGRKRLADYGHSALPDLAERIFVSYPDFPARQGTYCPAGFEYVYITPALDVYTCIPYVGRQDGFLGNCLRGTVKLRERPTLCELPRCHCVPGR